MLNKHILKNLVSKFFGLGVNVINQIALIPLFIKFWGVEKYGDWIIISTIMSFFSMSNVGFNDVIANKFVIAYTEKKFDLCRKYLTNNYFLLIFITSICLIGLFGITSFFDVDKLFSTKVTLHKELIFVVYFLFFQIITAQFSAVLNAIYRSVKKTYVAFYLEDGAKVTELLIMLICIFYNSSFAILSLLLLLPKIFLWIYNVINTKKYFDYRFTVRDFDIRILKEAAVPSLSFMAFPFGYALINQGFTLIIAKKFTAEILILFNTTRTLCNFIKTFIGIFQVSVWPEYSIAFGNRDITKMRKIHRGALYFSMASTILIGIVLLTTGVYIYRHWTDNMIEYNFYLMALFLSTVLFGNVWYSSSVVQMATNNHSSISVYFMLFSILSLFCAILVLNIYHSILYVAGCLFFLDIPMAIITVKQSLKLTEDTIFGVLLNK